MLIISKLGGTNIYMSTGQMIGLWIQHYMKKAYIFLVDCNRGFILKYIKKTIRYEMLLGQGKFISFEFLYLSCYRIAMKASSTLIFVVMAIVTVILNTLEVLITYDLFLPYLIIIIILFFIEF